MTTAVDDGPIPRNPVSIKSGSAKRTIERPLLTGDDVRALAGAIHPRFECPVWTAAANGPALRPQPRSGRLPAGNRVQRLAAVHWGGGFGPVDEQRPEV
jgi:hypothetical protein